MVDSPVLPEEYAYPEREGWPEEVPLGRIKKDEVWFPASEYRMGFENLMHEDSVHYELEIPKKEMMKFVSANDGSPMAAVAAIMVKALNRALPENRLPFRVETNHNYRSVVGCPKTHHDLLSHIFCFIPYHAQTWPINKICTAIRGATQLQIQPEYAYHTLRKFYEYTDGIDGVKGLNEKNQYARKNSHRVPDVHNSFLINYMGREDWGGMTEYVERAHVITDGHLLYEILDVGDNFCISLMQINKKKTYMECFCQILEEEKIPYKIHGMFKNHLPISQLEHCSHTEGTEK